MIENNSGVKRPALYVIAAIFAAALAVPLAVSSGQTTVGGIFDECFDEADCSPSALYARAEN